jgi:hypothetical protein
VAEFPTGELLLLIGLGDEARLQKCLLECTNEFEQVKGQGRPNSVLGFVAQICPGSKNKMLAVTESEQAEVDFDADQSMFLLDSH